VLVLVPKKDIMFVIPDKKAMVHIPILAVVMKLLVGEHVKIHPLMTTNIVSFVFLQLFGMKQHVNA